MDHNLHHFVVQNPGVHPEDVRQYMQQILRYFPHARTLVNQLRDAEIRRFSMTTSPGRTSLIAYPINLNVHVPISHALRLDIVHRSPDNTEGAPPHQEVPPNDEHAALRQMMANANVRPITEQKIIELLNRDIISVGQKVRILASRAMFLYVLANNSEVISPTDQQVESKDICSVCLMEIEGAAILRKLKCEHAFHQQCIDRWLLTYLTCPLCRRGIMGNAFEINETLVDEEDFEPFEVQADADADDDLNDDDIENPPLLVRGRVDTPPPSSTPPPRYRPQQAAPSAEGEGTSRQSQEEAGPSSVVANEAAVLSSDEGPTSPSESFDRGQMEPAVETRVYHSPSVLESRSLSERETPPNLVSEEPERRPCGFPSATASFVDLDRPGPSSAPRESSLHVCSTFHFTSDDEEDDFSSGVGSPPSDYEWPLRKRLKLFVKKRETQAHEGGDSDEEGYRPQVVENDLSIGDEGRLGHPAASEGSDDDVEVVGLEILSTSQLAQRRLEASRPRREKRRMSAPFATSTPEKKSPDEQQGSGAKQRRPNEEPLVSSPPKEEPLDFVCQMDDQSAKVCENASNENVVVVLDSDEEDANNNSSKNDVILVSDDDDDLLL